MHRLWLIAFVVGSGCASPNVVGTWQIVGGAEPCADWYGRHIGTMAVDIWDSQGYRLVADRTGNDFEYSCHDGWFVLTLPPDSYTISVWALGRTVDEDIGLSSDYVYGSSPNFAFAAGDDTLELAPFLVDVGPR
jgi:hypothetical protein